MKIGNVGVASTLVTAQQSTDASAAAGDQTAPLASASEASAYTPSSQLTNLTTLVQQQPDVRIERVQDVLQRLQQGDYDTPAAADQTAAAMLSALD